MRAPTPSIPLGLAVALLAAACVAAPPVPPDPESAEVRSPESDVPAADVPESEVPESEAPESDVPESGDEPAAPPTGLRPPADDELTEAELSTVGWDGLSGSPVVLLREVDGTRILPIWIGLAEAQAIGRELHGIETPRPMTHDLVVDLLESLGARLEEVVVVDLRQSTFYGLLGLRMPGGELRWVDTRPSDGLALALRTDARIRVAKKLVEELPDYDFLAPEPGQQVVRAAGLTVVAVDDERRRQHGLPADRGGLVVIAAGDVARGRGLARGDLIVAIGGRPARAPVDLLDAAAAAGPEGVLELTVWREDGDVVVTLPLDRPRDVRRPEVEV